MLLNAKAFANAATVITAIFYLVCWLVSAIAPDLVYSFASAWIHTLNLESVRSSGAMPLGTAVYGLVSISTITWITTYVMIGLYNRWAK